MSVLLRSACVQLNCGVDIGHNLCEASVFIRQAVEDGARYVLTPEVTDQVVSNRAEHLDAVYSELDHPAVAHFSDLARELGVFLCIGSLCVKSEGDKVANRSLLFGPNGEILQRYDKIHLYDVDLPSGESHRESKLFHAGERMALGDLAGVGVGMSICYDLRFAQIYRDMAQNGAQILNVPAAFTVPTGQAHWEVLLRARAIETGSFVMAAAQCGDHDGARQTYGHSMLIDPWGVVVASMGEGEGYICADLDFDKVREARASIPALQHDRKYEV